MKEKDRIQGMLVLLEEAEAEQKAAESKDKAGSSEQEQETKGMFPFFPLFSFYLSLFALHREQYGSRSEMGKRRLSRTVVMSYTAAVLP